MGRTTKAQYAKHYREYQGTPEQIEKRKLRNQARTKKAKAIGAKILGKGASETAKKKAGLKKLKGKDVGHKKRLAKGGTNASKNLKVQSVKKNRGWKKKGKKKA